MSRFIGFVVNEMPNRFRTKAGKDVDERVLTVVDSDSFEGKCEGGTYEYILNDEEFRTLPVGSCNHKTIAIGVAERLFVVGRRKLRGAISKACCDAAKGGGAWPQSFEPVAANSAKAAPLKN